MRWTLPLATLFPCATAQGRDVPITVRGDAGADFQIARWSGWQTLCRTPCSTTGPSDGLYRITGADIIPSPTLRLPAYDMPVLEASTTTLAMWRDHSGVMFTGIVIGGIGAAGLLAGVFWSMALFNDHCRALSCTGSWDVTGPNIMIAGGAVTLAFGAILLVLGASGRHASRLLPFRAEF